MSITVQSADQDAHISPRGSNSLDNSDPSGVGPAQKQGAGRSALWKARAQVVPRFGDPMRPQTDDRHPDLLEERGITEAAVEELADLLLSFHKLAINRAAQRDPGTIYVKGLPRLRNASEHRESSSRTRLG